MRNRSDIDPFDELDFREELPSQRKKSPSQSRRISTEENDWEFYSAPSPPRRRKPKKSSRGFLWVILLVAAIVVSVFIFRPDSGTKQPKKEPILQTEPSSQHTSMQDTSAIQETAAPTIPETTTTTEPVPQWEVRYFGKRLTDSQRVLYNRIIEGIMNHDSEIQSIRLPSHAELEPIMEAVNRDYPELFWYHGYSYSYYTREGYDDITLEPNYRWDKSEAVQRKAYVESATRDILSQLRGKSDYEKVKGVFDYLVDQTAYDYDYVGTTIYELLHDHRAVCEGYARTTQYLLNQLGVETLYISGTAGSNGKSEDHAWNIVLVDGNYYQLDVTWGDPLHDDGSQSKLYDYLCITDEEMRRDHTADWSEYPSCTRIDRNYFVMEGRYLPDYNQDTLVSWVREAYPTRLPLSFKLPNQTIYQQTMDRLFEADEIFTIFERAVGSSFPCSYAGNERMYIITIYWN